MGRKITISHGSAGIELEFTPGITTSSGGSSSKSITLNTSDGEPYMELTVHVPGVGDSLPKGNIIVNTWGENKAITDQLLEQGLFADTGRRMACGSEDAQVWEVLVDLDLGIEEKKMFRVIAYSTAAHYIEIEAENEDDAVCLAQNIDGGDFTEIDQSGDWRIDRASKIIEKPIFGDEKEVVIDSVALKI